MAGGSGKSSKCSNPTRIRKRVEVDSSDSSNVYSLKRAKDGSAFTRCDGCNKDVAVALISFHNCTLDTKIKMNLEAQVVELPSQVKEKAEKKRSKTAAQKPHGQKAKNSNAPKRPPTAFFIFMEEFRKSFKEANPDCKSVSTVAKEGGEKWKSLSDKEKKPYQDRAAELKAEYEKALETVTGDAENEHDDDSHKEAEEIVDGDGNE